MEMMSKNIKTVHVNVLVLSLKVQEKQATPYSEKGGGGYISDNMGGTSLTTNIGKLIMLDFK